MPLEQPWAIDGPEVSAATARQVAYSATGGNSGVTGPKDLQVRQTSTPGTSVQVLPGSYVVVNRNAKYQSYTGRNLSADLVDIPASGTTAKTWYLGVELLDPEFAGNGTVIEGKEDEFEYVHFVLRTSLTENTKTWLPLAKITVPANTGTITNAMIKDLREMANPRMKIVTRARPSIGTDTGMKLSSTTGEWFPGDGAEVGSRQEIEVPYWATRMIVEASWLSVRYNATSNTYGSFWISYGPSNGGGAGGEPFLYKTQEFQFDSAGSTANAYRTNWLLADDRAVESNMRDKLNTFAFRAKRNAASTNNAASMDGMSGLTLKVTFLEEADPSTE